MAQAAAIWTTYAEQQTRKGAGSAHRLIKRDELVGPDFSTVGHGPNFADRNEWQSIWTRLGDAPGAPWQGAAVGTRLAPITGREVQKAAALSKTRTSVGVDSLHPRAFQLLSQPLQKAIAAFLDSVEGLLNCIKWE